MKTTRIKNMYNTTPTATALESSSYSQAKTTNKKSSKATNHSSPTPDIIPPFLI